MHVGVGLKVAGDREGLKIPEDVLDTETDRDVVGLTETERDLLGLIELERDVVELTETDRDLDSVTETVDEILLVIYEEGERDEVTEGLAAGHPKPLVHVGVGLKVAGDREGLKIPEDVLDTETDPEGLIFPDDVLDTETEREAETDDPNVPERDVVTLTEELAAGHPKPLVQVGVALKVAGDREGLKIPDDVLDTVTDREEVTLEETDDPNVAERDVLGLAAGHPKPLVHVGVGVRVEIDAALEKETVAERERERDCETEIVAVRDTLEVLDPETDPELEPDWEYAIVTRILTSKHLSDILLYEAIYH